MRAETTVKRLGILTAAAGEGGPGATTEGEALQESEAVRLPRDARSVLLLAGYLALLVVGVVNLLEADYSGAVLVLAAIAGAVFVRGRLLNLAIWLGVLVLGLVMLAGLDLRGIVPLGVGILGALAAAWPDAAELRRLAPAEAPGEPDSDDEPMAPPARIQIRTIGRIEVAADGADLAPTLMEHRIPAFLWLYLLARVVSGDDLRVSRSTLADEVYPRLDASTQRQRLRGLLRDIQRLPEALSGRIQADGDLVRLNLTDCDLDAVGLRELANSCRGSELLPTRLAKEAAAALDSSGGGLFLPGWAELEHRVTGGRSAAGSVVNAARQQVSDDRADIVLALARTRLAAGQASEAARLLEDGLEASPHREDLVRLLVKACLQAGLTVRAKELQAEYAVKERV